MAKARTRRRYFPTSRRNYTHKKKQMTIPLAVVAGFVPYGMTLWKHRSDGNFGNYAAADLTGYDPVTQHWSFQYFKRGGLLILGGFAVHMIAEKIGVNRSLARAGIPFIRI